MNSLIIIGKTDEDTYSPPTCRVVVSGGAILAAHDDTLGAVRSGPTFLAFAVSTLANTIRATVVGAPICAQAETRSKYIHQDMMRERDYTLCGVL
jgi:hypothetical protein